MEYNKYSDLPYLYTKYIYKRNNRMDYSECAKELRANIRSGRLSELRGLLEPFSTHKDIRQIENQFRRQSDPPIDPINYAIDCGKEKLAIYLVEKAFPLNHVYWEDRAVCDEWCSKDHGPDKCTRQYDCARNAEKRGMETLKLRIDAIKQGKSVAGERISEPQIDRYMPHTPPPRQNRPSNKDDHTRFIPEKQERTLADEARDAVGSLGIKYCTRKGGTLLHMHVDKPSVFTYILANHGVPVNIQDTNGDTALHLAVRKGKMDVVEALVQCSADLTLRNKMGQTPVDEAEGSMKTFLRTFEPSVVVAVRDSHFNMLYRLYARSWSNVHTKVKEGKSLLDWTQEKAESMPTSGQEYKKEAETACKAFRILSDYRPTSELIHAVLCEDVELAKSVLYVNKGLSVNVRFRDRKGKTLLSHAIETNNYQMVELLVNHGANVAQVRVRENEQTDVTVPLYQKALQRDLDVNIVKLLQSVLPDSREHAEKDQNGNTPLLRAIEEGVDTRTIHWLIKASGGYSLLDRNKDCFTARELAQKRGRDNTVKMIDRYISTEIPAIVLRLFPVAFYPGELLTIIDEERTEDQSGDSLEQRLTKVAKDHNVDSWIDVNQTQNHAISLFEAAARGDVAKVQKMNNADYKDKNGYTALTRAIVFNQFDVANQLCITRPALRKIGDNCNRYPLHYAYAIPEDQSKIFVRLLLEQDANDIENRVDKDGRVAALYKEMRGSVEVRQMLYDARTLDSFGKRGGPLGPWPKHAETRPPNMGDEE